MGAKPDVVVHLDPLGNTPLLEHRPIGSIVEMVTTNHVGVGGDECALTEPDVSTRKDLAVEAYVGPVIDLDVSILAAQDRISTDEDTVSNGDATVVGTLGIETAVVIDHDIVTDANLVGMAEHDVLPEDHVPSHPSQEPGIEL